MLNSKIKNKNNPNMSIPRLEPNFSKNIIIDLKYFCFQSINIKFFTNYLKDEIEYFKSLNNLYKQTIPHLTSKKFDEVDQDRNSHCHYLNGQSEIMKVVKILEHYKNIGFELPSFEDESEDFYQLGGPNGIRLIGYRIDNIFYLLFLDFHHLVSSSIKFNNYDYKNYSYSDSDNWIGNIEIINYEEFFLENCSECIKFDEITSPKDKKE